MICPKCKARIGLHYHEQYLQAHCNAQGVSCYICGYWVNSEHIKHKTNNRNRLQEC